MFVGTLGYTLYIGSFLSYNFNKNGDFVTAAGAILGACAGLLWSSHGSIMLSYPTEGEKGRYVPDVKTHLEENIEDHRL